MKGFIYILLAVFLIGASACGRKGKSKDGTITLEAFGMDTVMVKTTAKFLATEYDFGQVDEGTKVTHVYEVLNTGSADLLLQRVSPSCGCTTPKYDKKPIRPGKKGSIEIVFDTRGRPGMQRKTVLVVTNTEPSNTVLTFTCEVLPGEKTVK